jgi:hypothetical protein
LLLLTVEEMAVNELRETFHHWVRTVALPIKGGVLGDAAGLRRAAWRASAGRRRSERHARRGRSGTTSMTMFEPGSTTTEPS